MMTAEEELLAKATRPADDALRLHPFYQGKIQVVPKCPVPDLSAFAVWYTPGVAAPRKTIQAQPDLVADDPHTPQADRGPCIRELSSCAPGT